MSEDLNENLKEIARELKTLNKVVYVIGWSVFNWKMDTLEENEQMLRKLIREKKCSLKKRSKNR